MIRKTLQNCEKENIILRQTHRTAAGTAMIASLYDERHVIHSVHDLLHVHERDLAIQGC